MIGIRAAGGVCWRPSADGVHVCVVHRPRHGDWTLPKGKLEPGEHPMVAAVREVAEETSVHGVPMTRLPTIRYLTGEPGVEKVVHFWSMRADTWSDRAPDDEIEEVRWAPANGAHHLLSYAHDRGVVKVKTPNYWRRDAELEAMARKHERRPTRVLSSA